MRVRFLHSRQRLPWIATLLVVALSVAFGSPRSVASQPLPDVVVSGLAIKPRPVSVKLLVSLPDLTVSSLSLAPNHGQPGAQVTVTLTAQNTGSASAATSVGLHLAPTPDSALPDTTILGTVAVPPLARGGSTQLTTTLTIPVADAGDYQLLSVIDSAEVVAESIETNNRRTASLVIDSPDAGGEWAPNPYGILVSGMDHNTPRSEIAIVMQKAKEGGARWVRTDFWWYSAEWFHGQWNWSHFDNVVEEASARGMEVIPILWGTPAWAATDGVVSYGVPDLSAWETFVRQTVTRYRDRITVWEIWNEPDTTFYFKGTPTQYAAILARAATAIRAVAPHAQVWLGGLAQGGIYAVPDFLEQILAAGAGANFDVHNVHTNFQTMTGMTAQLARNQALVPDKPLVVTEASYASNPAYQWLPGYTGGEEGQARYLVDAYHTMLGAGVKVAVWANIQDYQGDHEYASSGLVRINLSEKPAFWAFQDLAESAP